MLRNSCSRKAQESATKATRPSHEQLSEGCGLGTRLAINVIAQYARDQAVVSARDQALA